MKHTVLLALLAAVISGISIYVNSLFVSGADPLAFVLVRNALVAALLFAGILVFRGLPYFRLPLSDWKKLIVVGIVGGGIPFVLFFTGLRETGGVAGNIINKSLFLWVTMLAYISLKEKPKPAALAALAFLAAGTFAGSGIMDLKPGRGLFMVLAATMIWSVEYILAKRTLKTVPVTLLAFGRMLFGLPVLVVWSAFRGTLTAPVGIMPQFLLPVALSGFLLALFMVSWYGALRRSPAYLVSGLLTVSPAVSVFAAAGFSGKPVTGNFWSIGLLAAGAILITVSALRRPSVHES
ncbi:hypothetical protein A2Z33_01665 [Candidatus Gottesmanbacteria bacterium RBG_16_52_11]|uniref:EamA domain-containing protein n=1 Tax=Candidatus Gottesmanbacteria bacterium RBG_16_52_11 TaxID=1798374 RepID=A0A1F5YP71_9BACT|nr:MAG: hypothetical protein A2Z33_01665 [Candidatus Gottesmanbacteria bacterium RBG_16_52_11]